MLQVEINDAFRDVLCGKAFSYQEVFKLPRLNDSIKEAFRLQPPARYISECIFSPSEAVFDGYSVLSSTIVEVNAWYFHLRFDIYSKQNHALSPPVVGLPSQILMRKERKSCPCTVLSSITCKGDSVVSPE